MTLLLARRSLLAGAGVALAGRATAARAAANVRILCTRALTEAMRELGPAFEHASGCPFTLSYGTTDGLVAWIEGGEGCDVVVVSKAALARLMAHG